MIKLCGLFLLALITVQNCIASDDHVGHSDDLLILLQHKIALVKLQTQFENLAVNEQSLNRAQQTTHFEKALPRLKRYLAIPQSRYANLDMYAQSLESRSALLQDYAKLIFNFHQM